MRSGLNDNRLIRGSIHLCLFTSSRDIFIPHVPR